MHAMKDTIGGRSYYECVRVFGTTKIAASKLHTHMSTIYNWRVKDLTPNAHILASMMKAGCDMKYILLGERR